MSDSAPEPRAGAPSGPPGVPERPTLAGRPLEQVCAEAYDLVVVGGGITGAGVARHAAQAGLKTLLLEAADFGAGTSSRSTKLIHGGLRYLAMGELALVREGALERKSLLQMAPHLTEPRWMLVPARSLPEFWKLRIGIGLYERLGAVARAERHRTLNRSDLARLEPAFDNALHPWACVYREYLADDARLVLGALRAAVQDGATVCNYTQVTGMTRHSGGCTLRVRGQGLTHGQGMDQSQDAREGGESGDELTVTARVVVNAAGPWVEDLLRQAGAAGPTPPATPRLHLSKGVHLVLPRARLPVRHMVMLSAPDGRPVFAIARGEVTYVGTTDTSFAGGPVLWPEVLPGDVDYLLAAVNGRFGIAPIRPAEVLASWAGLRPLINQPGKAPKEMSRRDEVWTDGALVSIAGGKLTGFRKMAEEVMAAVGRILGRELTMPEPLRVLPGGDLDDVANLCEAVSRRYRIDDMVAQRLVRLYGSEVWPLLGENPRRLSPSVFEEEVVWAARIEGARTLEDVIYRRLRAAWFLPQQVPGLLEGAARVLGGCLGWSTERRAAELAATRARLDAELAFREPARVAPAA